MQRSRKRLALAQLLLLAASVLVVASIGRFVSASPAAVHDHASPGANSQDELAQVRRATARFHDLDEAISAGYQLGWVNGSNVRILTGCVAVAMAMSTGGELVLRQARDNLIARSKGTGASMN